MTLEDLVKPLKWVDEQVLTQYTRLGTKLKLDEGKDKYYTSLGLNLIYFTAGSVSRPFFGVVYDLTTWLAFGTIDNTYSFLGTVGIIKDDTIDNVKQIDERAYIYKKYNSLVRLPALIAGLGFIGKAGFDITNNLLYGTPLESYENGLITQGIGLLSVASSMYIKEIDPKLLNKEKLWKRVYTWAKEKVKFTIPIPQPVPQN